MTIFRYSGEDVLGKVAVVDTTSVTVIVDNIDVLRKMQVNRLVALRSSRAGQHLIGMIHKMIRKAAEPESHGESGGNDEFQENNTVKILLIGTFFDALLNEKNVFRRTLETVPEIDAECYPIEGDKLTRFMRAISFRTEEEGPSLSLGHYTLDEEAVAYLDANKFFQRHAAIVGSTGSGKSYATARLVEQIAALPNGNAILFDLHGEYKNMSDDGIKHYKIAGPNDGSRGGTMEDGILYFPYWLLGYEDMIGLLVERTDQHAPNQSMVLSRAVTAAKLHYLEQRHETDFIEHFTVDSPIPYRLEYVLDELKRLNQEMVPGAKGERQGDFHGKLSRLIARLENKMTDRRLGFMMNPPEETYEMSWLDKLASGLLCGRDHQADKRGGVKIVDFSELPSDILPLVIGRVAHLVFTVQLWTEKSKRHPIILLCDEAHLYIPNHTFGTGAFESSQKYFERIAKEGRKYGVGLVVVSQRPSEVNKTVLSQCHNFVALRLTNAEDQLVIKKLLPDSLGGFADLLPVLDTGEALIVGDASLLPSRVRITEPRHKPDSGAFDVWDEWSDCEKEHAVNRAVKAWRRQSMKE